MDILQSHHHRCRIVESTLTTAIVATYQRHVTPSVATPVLGLARSQYPAGGHSGRHAVEQIVLVVPHPVAIEPTGGGRVVRARGRRHQERRDAVGQIRLCTETNGLFPWHI